MPFARGNRFGQLVTREERRTLKPHRIESSAVTREEVEALQAVIDGAEDERPVQRHLAEHPNLISGALLSGGHGRWLVPQVRLAAHFVADFMIAEADSSGIGWELIELESPTSPMFTATGQLAEKARHGLHQIHQWRYWLAENLDAARKPREAAGLGLVGIGPDPDGLVLLGRRPIEYADRGNPYRAQVDRHQRVRIHTYDWLIERLWARLAVGDAYEGAIARLASDAEGRGGGVTRRRSDQSVGLTHRSDARALGRHAELDNLHLPDGYRIELIERS